MRAGRDGESLPYNNTHAARLSSTRRNGLPRRRTRPHADTCRDPGVHRPPGRHRADAPNDPGSGGPENAWTTRTTVFMTSNILHYARILENVSGVPAYGNSTKDWDLS